MGCCAFTQTWTTPGLDDPFSISRATVTPGPKLPEQIFKTDSWFNAYTYYIQTKTEYVAIGNTVKGASHTRDTKFLLESQVGGKGGRIC